MPIIRTIADGVQIQLDTILFADPNAHRRWLERVESRYFEELQAAKPSNFEDVLKAYDLIASALRNFDPVAHMERVRERNEAR
jgi:hypothetical protein